MNNNLKEKELELLIQMKHIRESLGLTQRGLCSIIDMLQPALVKIENGQISPQLSTILKVLDPLGYTISFVKKENK